MCRMSVAPDFRLYHGNDLELLAAVLADELAKPVAGASILEPDTILIPQPAMKRWLQNALAEAHGIAANLRFLTPGEFVREALAANLADGDDAALADAAILRWRLWQQLADPALTREPVFAPLRPLLDGGAPGERRRAAWSLAGELAAAFEKYQAWRRDWLSRWDRGGDPRDWQAELWRRVTRGRRHRGARLEAYLAQHGGEYAVAPRGLPARVFAFACQNVSPDVLRVIASAARSGTLHFFFVSPVASWWGDLQTARERLRADPDAPFEADDETPLLRANGAAGRDFVRLLFSYEIAHPSLDLPIYAAPDEDQRRGLLHRLQRDLFARRPLPSRDVTATLPAFDPNLISDRSLQVHACATCLRELQVLHDQLRALLDADPTLQPRDIAVLAPDIDLYAPQVHAVFGAVAGMRDFIPYAVADASAAATQPLVAAFLRVLALPQSRFGVNEVLDLLALPAIAQHLGLETPEFERLRVWLEAAGARWGLDAAHRVALGAPDEAAYSWVWAIERLLLGHASGSTRELAGVAPLPLLEGGALMSLDALLQGLRTLARLRRELAIARPILTWQTLLTRALEDLFPPQPDDIADRRALEQLRAALQRFAVEAAQAEVDTPIPPEVLRDWFAAALGESNARQPFLTGGVTFGRMVPMRLIPFRVVALLGMNDGAFPRRDPVGGLNRIDTTLGNKQRRLGDRSLREDDRALFLQLFAAATDTFYLSFLGLDARSGEALPPSVVVSELLDVAAAAFANAKLARERLVVRHPLQPFSAQAFGAGDARRLSYRDEWRLDTIGTTAMLNLPRFAVNLPTHAAPIVTERLTLEELRRDLSNPARAFLRHRLGLRLDAGRARLPEDEPFGRDDPLRLHAVKQRLFAELIATDAPPDVDTLRCRLLAEGWIAPAAAGAQEIVQLRGALLRARGQWREWAQGAACEQHMSVTLHNVQLSATLGPVHDTGLLQFRAGKAHGKTRLDLGLEWLLWSAQGETRPVLSLVLEQGAKRRVPLAPERARAALTQLLSLRQRAREQALPVMPKSAWVYAEAITKGEEESAAFARARREWMAQDYSDGHDPWVRLALRGADPFELGNEPAAQQFRTLALELFSTLHEVEVAHEFA